MPPGELPDWLAEHARRFYAEGREPAVPRRAATVLLLREVSGVREVPGVPQAPGVREVPGTGGRAGRERTAAGFEVYLIRRAASMAFASGFYAYPGGGVDARDAVAGLDWAGPPPREWGRALGLPETEAQAVVCAAVREVFEETGVLLAGDLPAGPAPADGPDGVTRGPAGGSAGGPAGGAVDLAARRSALVAGRISLADLLAELRLPLRSDLLAPWARWITPEVEPRRYDTWFFLARLPHRQDTRDVSGEADHTVWLRPQDTLDLPMLPPTRSTLADLAGFPTIDAAMAAPRDAATPVLPRIQLDPDSARLVI